MNNIGFETNGRIVFVKRLLGVGRQGFSLFSELNRFWWHNRTYVRYNLQPRTFNVNLQKSSRGTNERKLKTRKSSA